jgi:hypothetical protein
MPALVENGYKIFTDVDGDPLENGSIIIGEPNLNPLASPKQAYWDSELTTQASNIKTKGGYPDNNGTPGRLYVEGNYSILVKDKKGATVYTLLNSVDYFNAPIGNEMTVNPRYYGALGGTEDDTQIIEKLLLEYDSLEIDSNITIKSTLNVVFGKNLIFKGGGAFTISTGITVTIDGFIDAPEQYIFKGLGTVETTNRYQNGYPNNNQNPNTLIYAKWFGVLNDVVYETFYSPDGIPAGSATIGAAPTVGTDSTIAMGKALLYCQQASVTSTPFEYSETSYKLMLPAGMIYVTGNNPMGSQLFRSEIETLYADAALGTIVTLPLEIDYSSYKLVIHGQNTIVLWKPTLAEDKFIDLYFTVTGVDLKDFTCTPLIPEGDIMGIMIYNKSYGLPNTIVDHRNSLGNLHLENTNCMQSSNGGKSQMNGRFFATIDKIFWFEGYSRADKVSANRCNFYGFRTGVRCDNPESVLHNWTNCWWFPSLILSERVYVFDYAAFFGGFRSDGCYYALKGDSITLLRTVFETDLYIGDSIHAGAVFHFLEGNRIEGSSGANGLYLYDGYSGKAVFDGLNASYGGAHSSGLDAKLTNSASAIFRNGKYIGQYQIDSDNMDLKTPAVVYDNCTFTLTTYAAQGIYPNSNYFFETILAGDSEVPTIQYKNGLDDISPAFPEFYGTQYRGGRELTESLISYRSGTSLGRIGQPGVTYTLLPVSIPLPTYIVIEELYLNLPIHSSAVFDGLRITFTNTELDVYVLNVSFDGTAKNDLDILPSGKYITTSAYKTEIKVEFTLASVPVADYSYSGALRMKYRPILSINDVLTSSNTEPHEIPSNQWG